MDVAVKYEDFHLIETDLGSFSSPTYLSVQIIEFYFSYVSSITEADDVLFFSPQISVCLAYDDDVDFVKGIVEPLGFGTKNLIFFVVYGWNHWSLLVYDRKLNEFLHHDSIEGVNNMQAMKLYNVFKDFVVPSNVKPKKLKRSKKGSVVSKSAAPSVTSPPSFKECPTPQQTTGYDCGLFVMAIARAICEWHCSKKKSNYWFKEKQVNPATVEMSMRSEVLNLIKSMK